MSYATKVKLWIIAKIWKQPKYPSADEWIKIHTYHTYNGILLSHKKKPFATADLEGFMLREISHIERQILYVIIHGITKSKNNTKECT